MNNIVAKQQLSASVHLIEAVSPEICARILPGQFVILRAREKGERIPLTVAKKDPEKGTITIIFQVVGKTTRLLSQLKTGDSITDLLGPLGNPSEIKNFGTVVIIGGGVGIAEILPVCAAMKAAGNRTICIIGARSRELLMLENELKDACTELHVTTDDGSYGRKGFVSDVLKDIIAKEGKPGLVHAVGPVPMMKVTANLTREHGIHTVVSLNTIMVDGTGMCGSCRIKVGDRTLCACVDGPEFDGHLVDWDELGKRLKLFVDYEKEADNNG